MRYYYKIALFIIPILAASSSFAYEPYSYPKKEVTAQADKVEPPVVAVGEEEKAPVELSGTFIYWKVNTTDSAYAVSASTNQFNLPYDAELRQVHFDYTPGFKIGLGWHTDHDNWTIKSELTYLKANQADRLDTSKMWDLITPTGFSNAVRGDFTDVAINLDLYFERASSIYGITYGTIDLMLQRSYNGGLVTFTPKIGLDALTFTGEKTNYYSGGVPLSDNTLTAITKSEFQGLGPKSGLGMEWAIRNGFSIVQDLSIACYLGSFKGNYSENYSASNLISTKFKGSARRIIPHASTVLGLGYEKGTNFLLFKRIKGFLAFEGHYLWGTSQKTFQGQDFDYGDLFMYGLTLNMTLDF